MLCVRRCVGAAIALAVMTMGAAAGAQATDRQSEIFYLTPIVGAEYVGLGSAALQMDYQGVQTNSSSGVGLAYGAHAGFVLGNFRVGALYQRTQLFRDDDLSVNKLYAEAGIGGRRGPVGLGLTLGGGWAFFNANGLSQRNGAGGRVTFAADFYLGRFFSLGPAVSVDGAAYFADETVYGSWGITGVLRAGLHL